MAEPSTSAVSSAAPSPEVGPLVFHPKRPPTGWRRLAAIVGALGPFVLLAALLLDGPPTTLTIVATGFLALSGSLLLYTAIDRRRSGTSRYDARDEVVLPAELVANARALKLQDRRAEAWDLVSSETGLGLDDTVRALELIDATIPPGAPRVKARWGGLGASR